MNPALTRLTSDLAEAAGTRIPGGRPALEPTAWQAWFDLVARNHLAAWLVQVASPDLRSSWPVAVRRELASIHYAVLLDSMVRAREARRILDALGRDSVEFIVLKGAGLFGSLYETFADRPMGDVDILVRDADEAARAARALDSLGYLPGSGFQGHHHLAPLRSERRLLAVEIHTNLVTPGLPAQALNGVWDRSIEREFPGLPPVQVLSPLDACLHHALHAITNPVDAPFLRDLLETSRLRQALTPEEEAVAADRVRQWGYEAWIHEALRLATTCFGTAPLSGFRSRARMVGFWAERRLAWPDAGTLGRRIGMHLARTHIEAMLLRGSALNLPSGLLPILISGSGRALSTRWRFRRGHAWTAPDWPSADVGQGRLLYDTGSGEVHLLNAEARAALDAVSRGEPAPEPVVRELARKGILA